MHGFGGVVGFSYAMENERNVKALAFYEAYLRPMNEKSKLAVPAQQLFTSLLQNPEQSHKAVVQNNFLVKKILAHGLARPITAEELANYEAPLQSKEHREILWKNVQNFNKSTNSLVEEQAKYLKTTNKPKLLLYNVPGFVISMETIRWCQNNFPNLAVAELGEGYNFGQETDPKSFAKALQEWYKRIK
jgi:haloalkane dehalogenase